MYRDKLPAIFLTITFVIMASPSLAEDSAEVQAFNDAWVRYQEAEEQGGSESLIETSRAVLDAARKIFPPSDDRLPVLITNYGVALLEDDRKDEAKEVLQEALVVAEEIHGDDSMELVTILYRLGNAESEWGSPRRQLKYFKRALRIVVAQTGEDSEEYADMAAMMGSSVMRYSGSAIGQRYLLDAKAIYEAKLGEQSMQYGSVAFQLGKLEFSRGKYRNSIEDLLAALNAFENNDEDSRQYQLMTRALLVRAYELRGQSDLATEHCVAIGKISKLQVNQDYQPLFRMAPRYPVAMLRYGVEGHVDVEFSIDTNGFTRDLTILEQVGSKGGRKANMSLHQKKELSEAAMNAVERFRYAPKFVDGQPVEVDGIRTRITFELQN